jgi:hypothetical protein
VGQHNETFKNLEDAQGYIRAAVENKVFHQKTDSIIQ